MKDTLAHLQQVLSGSMLASPPSAGKQRYRAARTGVAVFSAEASGEDVDAGCAGGARLAALGVRRGSGGLALRIGQGGLCVGARRQLRHD